MLAFDFLQSPGGPERDIRVCDLETRACEAVATHPAIDAQPVWAPDGRLLFNSDRAGTMGLWAVELSGLRQVAAAELVRDTGRGRMVARGFGPNGLLYYTLESGGFDIYSASLDVPTGQELTAVRLSPRAVDVNRTPVWSPDGQSIAYVSRRGPFAEKGSMRMVIQSISDKREREFHYDIPPNMTRLAWSPDGRILAMRTMIEGTFGIHLVDATNGAIRKTLRRQTPPERYVEEQISDLGWIDRNTIAFSSLSGVRTFDVTSGDERELWAAPAGTIVHGMAVSPDSGRIAVTLSDTSKAPWSAIVAVPTGGGPPQELLRTSAPEMLWTQTWDRDGQAVLVTRWNASKPFDAQRPQLWRVQSDTGSASPLPLALAGLSEVRLHPDGLRMAFTAGAPHSEFWMMTIR